MADKKTFVMYKSWNAAIENMSDEQAGSLMKAIFAYQNGQGDISIDPAVRFVFDIIRQKMEEDSEQYAQKCAARSDAGRRGNAKRWNESQTVANVANAIDESQKSQTVANVADTESESDTDTESESDFESDSGFDSGSESDFEKPEKQRPKDPSVNPDKPDRHESAPQWSVDLMNDFNSTCSSLPHIRGMTNKRLRSAGVMLANFTAEEIHKIFKLAQESDFLSGRNGQWNGCGFDWLMNQNNAQKVLEGNYANKAPAGDYRDELLRIIDGGG